MHLLTKEGFAKLKESLLELQSRRPIVVQAIQEAKEQGDLSENAGYHISKADLRNIDKRIDEIQNILQTHPVKTTSKDKKVSFGVYVKVLELKQNQERVFRIVSEHELTLIKETDVDLLTSKSLVAKALIGRGLDEEVIIETHAGTREYKILDLSDTLHEFDLNSKNT